MKRKRQNHELSDLYKLSRSYDAVMCDLNEHGLDPHGIAAHTLGIRWNAVVERIRQIESAA